MITTNIESAIPRALREVWDWKATVSAESKGLTTAEVLQAIHREAASICEKYGIPRASIMKKRLCAAEPGATYVTKQESI
jgi:hypothetical protein